MADLVDLDEAKAFLRVEGDDEDATIMLMIAAASDAVRDVASDWDGTGDTPARVKLAVLGRVASMFDARDNMDAAKGEDRLLLPLRSLDC